MTTTLKYCDLGSSDCSVSDNWTEFDYQSFNIKNGLFSGQLAPELSFTVARNVSISGNDLVQVLFDGNVRFEGKTKSGGSWQPDGTKEYTANGNGFDIMDEEVTISETGSSPETIIDSALPSSYSRSTNTATTFTLDYNETKTRRSVIEDMIHRAGYIAWMDCVNKTLYFNPAGDRGNYATWTAGSDPVSVSSFEADDRSTLRNKVIIHGTKNGRDVTYTASNVLADYEEHKVEYNFDFVDNSTDAEEIAKNLVIDTPFSTGEIIAAGGEFSSDNLCNYEITISDPSKSDVSSVSMIIQEQKVKEGHMILKVGKGTQYGRSNENLEIKSESEKTKSGKQWSDVYDDGNAPDDNADVTSGNPQSFSWLTNTLNSGQVDDDLIVARMIAAGEIQALHIAADTITANEIDTLDLDTAELTVGDQGSSSVFTFGYSGGSDEVYMYPSNADGLLGLEPEPFYRLYAESLRPHNPGGAGSCGDNSYYWNSIYADTYYGKTTSIQSFTPPDYKKYTLDELKNWNFEEHKLPDFVIMPSMIEKRAKKENISEKKAEEKLLDDLNDNSISKKIESVDDLPDDSFPIDEKPIGIDRMIPVLLKVCQDQQEVIQNLESRMEKLEGKN